MSKIINELDLGELLFELSKKYKVIVPQIVHEHSTTGKVAFLEYKKNSKLALNYGTTILPPKEFLFPPKDILYETTNGKASPAKIARQLLFGVNLEDLEGTHYLTKVFEKPVSDGPFLTKRENAVIVAVDRFSPPKQVPFDVYLMRLPHERYLAYAGSRAGTEILKSRLFKAQNVKAPSVTKKRDELIWDARTSEAIEKSKDHPVWDELASICFGCGICSYTCPLCYCFETEDELSMNGDGNSQRCRTWDSCLLSSFAETTAGNFRPELRDRIYNWYYHKFVRMPREYGFPGCVSCNRCSIYCPAKINYLAVLARVKKDYEAKRKNERT